MKTESKSIMLIDDNFDDNFFHEREIKKSNPEHSVVINNSGAKALEYLKTGSHPLTDVIFLDINMPGMNGWEFLKEYEALSSELKKHTIVIMLTTSDNDDDRLKTKTFPSVSAYITKPLTRNKVNEIFASYPN
jgi:CheY-like chemotaxis protein